jgi:hypothetical protein
MNDKKISNQALSYAHFFTLELHLMVMSTVSLKYDRGCNALVFNTFTSFRPCLLAPLSNADTT